MLILFLVSSESFSCDILQCQHSSPCMIINELSPNGSYIARAKCLCVGSYIGEKCEGKLFVSESRIKTTSISLNVHISSSVSFSSPVHYIPDDITIHYWQNYSQLTCSIFTGKIGSSLTIGNLLPNTLYTLCVVNGHANYCNLDERLNSSLSCIEILTPERDSEGNTIGEGWIIPVIIVCGIMVILSGTCLCSAINCRKRRKVDNKKKHRKTQPPSSEMDFFLPEMCNIDNMPKFSERTMDVPAFPKSVPVVRPPKSPGRTPHKLSQQPMGYSSFKLRNSKSLSLNTVLECSGDDYLNEEEIVKLMPSNKENIH